MKTKPLHDQEFDAYAVDSVTIDDFTIDDEFKRVAADLAYWNAQHARAVRAHLEARLEVKRVRGALFLELRSKALEGKQRSTEKVLDSTVDVDSRYLTAARVEIAAEAERVHLRGWVDAVATKKDALQSLGARLRLEMEGDLRVRQQHAAARDYDREREG